MNRAKEAAHEQYKSAGLLPRLHNEPRIAGKVMHDMKMPPDKAALSLKLWETGRSKSSDDPENDMPLVVICTSACADLGVELAEARLEGDVRYLLASTSTSENGRDVPFGDAVRTSFAAMSNVGIAFIAVNPEVDSDLTVACEVARAARRGGLFAVALITQRAAPTCNAGVLQTGLLRAFDAAIELRAEWPQARSLACDVVRHLAGGLKVAPPVCTDLADVQGILRGAIVSVGVGEAMDSPDQHEGARERDAVERAIRDVGRLQVESATGVIVVITGDCSIRLLEIARATHQVGGLVKAENAAVIPTVHVAPATRDRFRIILLAAHRPIPDRVVSPTM
ncbi:hypothetical protein [Paraburkholderia strydomiana]|uniref:hypothetical protein n=1 Tax=Paraburkholderia strydomiana TaxID=1245417 RepID=UPI001BEC2D1F|nr:hypothetical protein [Paraburkholderia strydomiana]MBT2794743.1 hypothetical protein [Paraburkholderia strydomiana]